MSTGSTMCKFEMALVISPISSKTMWWFCARWIIDIRRRMVIMVKFWLEVLSLLVVARLSALTELTFALWCRSVQIRNF